MTTKSIDDAKSRAIGAASNSDLKPDEVIFELSIQDHDRDGQFSELEGASRTHWPVSFGFPISQDKVHGAERLRLICADETVPAEFVITNVREDGSARWVHCGALINLLRSESCEAQVVMVASDDMDRPGTDIWGEGENLLHVGPEEIGWKGLRTLPLLPEFRLRLKGDVFCSARWNAPQFEEARGLTRRVSVEGAYYDPDGRRLFDAELSWTLTAQQTWIEMTHRLRHRVTGRDQFQIEGLTCEWSLGEARVLQLRQRVHGEDWLPRNVHPEGEVVIDVTEGGATVTERQMVCELPPEAYPPYLRVGMDRVEPWIGWKGPSLSLLLWTADPTGKSPQRWTATDSTVRLEWCVPSTPVIVRQGQGFEHVLRWQMIEGENPDFREHFLRHELSPIVHPKAGWAGKCEDGGWEHSLRYLPGEFPRTESLLKELFRNPWPSGLMNCGDTIDPGYSQSYLSLGISGGEPVWTNNEYDALHAFIHQMYRTGNGRYWKDIKRMAEHVMNVDFLDFHDNPWLHHGSPVHSASHVTSSSYPSHIWTEGLLHYYYCSHDSRALRTAELSGEFILKFLNEKWWVFTATAREGGWALAALSELYRATGDSKFLDGARKIRDAYFERALSENPFFPGETLFFIGVAVYGLAKLDEIDPQEDFAKVVDRIMSWRLKNRLSPEGLSVGHWNAGENGVKYREHFFLDALTLAWRLTGKNEYLRQIWTTFQFEYDDVIATQTDRGTKRIATVYRSWHRALEVLRVENLLSKADLIPFSL